MIANKSKEQIQMFALIVIFLITGYFLVIVYFMRPQLRRAGELNGEIDALRQNIRKTKLHLKDKGKIDVQIETARKKIEDFEMRMPKGDESWSIEQLDQIAKRHGVIIKKIQPGIVSDKTYFTDNHRYDIREINVDVLCTYHKFGVFVNTLERSSPFLKIKAINISAGSEPDYMHKINFSVIYLVLRDF